MKGLDDTTVHDKFISQCMEKEVIVTIKEDQSGQVVIRDQRVIVSFNCSLIHSFIH